MTTRPSLIRSIPFWALVVASVASLAIGAVIFSDKIGILTTTLTDGSATGLDVYVSQTVAVFGAVLAGVGVLGLLIALAVAAVASLRPAAPAAVVEYIDTPAEVDVEDAVEDAPASAEPVTVEDASAR